MFSNNVWSDNELIVERFEDIKIPIFVSPQVSTLIAKKVPSDFPQTWTIVGLPSELSIGRIIARAHFAVGSYDRFIPNQAQ